MNEKGEATLKIYDQKLNKIKIMNNYKELLKEARDLLVLCTMLDKSDHC
jgi:hypothetical protein